MFRHEVLTLSAAIHSLLSNKESVYSTAELARPGPQP